MFRWNFKLCCRGFTLHALLKCVADREKKHTRAHTQSHTCTRQRDAVKAKCTCFGHSGWRQSESKENTSADDKRHSAITGSPSSSQSLPTDKLTTAGASNVLKMSPPYVRVASSGCIAFEMCAPRVTHYQTDIHTHTRQRLFSLSLSLSRLLAGAFDACVRECVPLWYMRIFVFIHVFVLLLLCIQYLSILQAVSRYER